MWPFSLIVEQLVTCFPSKNFQASWGIPRICIWRKHLQHSRCTMDLLCLHLEGLLLVVPKVMWAKMLISYCWWWRQTTLGAKTCQKLNFIKVMVNDVTPSETVNSVNDKFQMKPSVLTRERILQEYSDAFEGLGCMEGPCHLEVDETIRPVVHPPRKVPVALRGKRNLTS